ncbi:hypothetical protein FGRMN_11186 [Fusarium graminum]|nr:hypothetical protein FGRMN_11186 [Fusarium graminum]
MGPSSNGQAGSGMGTRCCAVDYLPPLTTILYSSAFTVTSAATSGLYRSVWVAGYPLRVDAITKYKSVSACTNHAKCSDSTAKKTHIIKAPVRYLGTSPLLVSWSCIRPPHTLLQMITPKLYGYFLVEAQIADGVTSGYAIAIVIAISVLLVWVISSPCRSTPPH